VLTIVKLVLSMKEYYLKVVDALMVISKITIMRVFNVIILVQLAKLLLRTVLVALGLIEKIIFLLVVVKMVITITEQISIVYNVQFKIAMFVMLKVLMFVLKLQKDIMVLLHNHVCKAVKVVVMEQVATPVLKAFLQEY